MLIELAALQKEFPGLQGTTMEVVRDQLADLGLPVDAADAVDGTWVLDVDITANRGDAMSHRGLARDLAARMGESLLPLGGSILPEGEMLHAIRIEADACPIYASAILELGKVSGTPEGIQRFLAHMGSNAKNMAPVDASNEILHRYGHPTHAFDADKLKGPVVVRWAQPGETLRTLDGVVRTVTPQDLVIADDSGPIAMAGVMGGDSTKVTESTRRVLLESAYFDPRVVRAMAHRHALHTDSSHRFGRGADPAMARVARNALAQRLIEWSDAQLLGAWTAGTEPPEAPPVDVMLTTLSRVAGEAITEQEASAMLSRLGCRVTSHGTYLRVYVPTWRHDLKIPEDLAEEVLRMRGYASIGAALPPLEGSPQPLGDAYAQRRRVAQRLANLGFHETVTLGFVSPEEDATAADEQNPQEGRLLGNPLGLEYSVMRASLLPSLRRAATHNLRQGAREVRLFELAPTFTSSPDGPQEQSSLGLLWAGVLGGEDYLSKPRAVQAADLIAVARDLGVAGPLEIQETAEGILALELSLERLPKPQERIIPPFTPFSRFPTVERDLSLLVGLDQAYKPLEDALRDVLPGDLLQDVRCVDVFRAKGLPPGKQAWLMRFRFQAQDRTLTGEEVDGWVAAARQAAETLGASLRT